MSLHNYNKRMRLKNNQEGTLDPLMIPLIVSVVLVIGLAVFGSWSYLQYLDQKNNVEATVETAVTEAEVAQKTVLEAEFAEQSKKPNVKWVSAASIGSIELTYPRTWSGFVDESDSGSNPLNGFFHPKVVPADGANYALRILVDEKDYTREVASYDQEIEKGVVKAKAITRAGVTGVRLEGEIDTKYSGAIVIFPLRDKTVRIWTESDVYLPDFNKIISSLTFEK